VVLGREKILQDAQRTCRAKVEQEFQSPAVDGHVARTCFRHLYTACLRPKFFTQARPGISFRYFNFFYLSSR